MTKVIFELVNVHANVIGFAALCQGIVSWYYRIIEASVYTRTLPTKCCTCEYELLVLNIIKHLFLRREFGEVSTRCDSCTERAVCFMTIEIRLFCLVNQRRPTNSTCRVNYVRTSFLHFFEIVQCRYSKKFLSRLCDTEL